MSDLDAIEKKILEEPFTVEEGLALVARCRKAEEDRKEGWEAEYDKDERIAELEAASWKSHPDENGEGGETWKQYACDLDMQVKARSDRIAELEAEKTKYRAGMQENCQLRKRIAELEHEDDLGKQLAADYEAATHHIAVLEAELKQHKESEEDEEALAALKRLGTTASDLGHRQDDQGLCHRCWRWAPIRTWSLTRRCHWRPWAWLWHWFRRER